MGAPGIPEPDVTRYGALTMDGQTIHAADDVSVVARVNGIANPVGTYHMGDNPGAGDRYLLRVRLESLQPGLTRTGNAALVGDTVKVLVKRGSEAEALAGEFVITDRGEVLEQNLSAVTALDVDGDGDSDLGDFGRFQVCFTGPNAGPPAPGCSLADRDHDSDVDAADYALVAQSFGGPR